MGEQNVDLQNEFYCFISYKHKKDGRFEKDQSWAERLEGSFHRTQIKVPPVAERTIIHGSSDDSNEYIGKIYRDFTNLSGGYYKEEIQSGLRCSRKLVSIVSDEMLADQNKIVEQAKQNGIVDIYNEAWCYKEIRDFLSFPNHTLDDVILVYIGEKTEFSLNLVPSPLLDRDTISNHKPVFEDYDTNEAFLAMTASEQQEYLDNYWRDRNAILVYTEGERAGLADLVAAKVACNIFGLKGEGAQAFISFRKLQLDEERAKEEAQEAREKQLHAEVKTEKEKRKRVFWTITVLALLAVSIFAFLLILSGNRRREEQAIRFMDRAQAMIQKGDRQKAMILARAAYEKSPRSSVIMDFMRQFQTESGTKPFSLLRYPCFVNPARNEIVYYDSEDNKTLYVLNGKDFSTRIVLRNVDFLNSLFFDSVGEKMLIAGADSIKIYDFVNDTFCKGIPYKGEFGDEIGSSFAFYGKYLLRVWRDSCVVNHLQSGKQTVIHDQGFDKAFVKDGLINCVRVYQDTMSIFTFDPDRMSFTPVKMYPLSNSFKHLYSGYFEISATSGNMAAVTSSGLIDYFGDDGFHHMLSFSEGFCELKFSQDGSCLMAVKTDSFGNKWIHVWRNGQYAKELYYSADKAIQSVFWGNGEDIVAISRERLSISRLGDSYQYELDKRVNLQYTDLIPERQHVVATDDALYYLSDSYDNQKAVYIGLLKYSYPNWQGFGSTSSLSPFETEFWKRFPQYSLHHHDNYFDSSNQLVFMADSSGFDVINVEQGKVVRLSYPSASASENWSNESFFTTQDRKDLYCLRRLFVPNDISSMAGDTEIMRIDMEKLSIAASTKIHDMVFLFGISLEGKLMMSDENCLYVLDGDSLQQIAQIDIEGAQIDKLIHIDGHRYLLPTTGKNLYELDLKDYSVSPSHLPFRSNSWRTAAFDNKYLQVKTNYSYGRMIYDVRNKKAVYFPDEMESIQDISNGGITVNYHSVDHDYSHSRTYVRPILSDEQILMLVDSLIGNRTLSETDLWELNY